ncbi:Trehalose-6-P synthase/phosphatase complex synthase subunit [Chytriomyces hyalinus]|nr:Trehalose-6-P synthase/phosphatase complex synthase subunit [Chytriomyces hyalinus]
MHLKTPSVVPSATELPLGPSAMSKRLLMVSNRLPITISNKQTPNTTRNTDTTNLTNTNTDPALLYDYKASSGGLVSGINGLSGGDYDKQWFGWPGRDIPTEHRQAVDDYLMRTFRAGSVYMDARTADLHYNGFSNGILWPLFHYLPGEINYDEMCWEAYQQANVLFADTLVEHIKDGDLIWIHDYHLMLLPALLRARLDPTEYPNIKMGFFLHIPFPSSEIYRILPVRREILTGVLAADLIGFHTYDYARHFLSSCARILGVHTMPNIVEFEGRQVHVGTFPIGIDPDKFTTAIGQTNVAARIQALKTRFEGLRVLVGVDRLDYIKGVPQKLRAFELFLQQHPEWNEKVVLVQIAVPSRQDVEEYQQLRDVVNELVGRINGRYGTMTFMPIHFVHRSVTFEELTALYSVSDACVVSSPRDGMNLVSYEYISCQQEKHGVLILSEFAGASQSLNGSLIVNPWNIEELSNAILEALTMPDKLKEENFKKLSRYVNKYTAAHWGAAFVRELLQTDQVSDSSQLPRLNPDDVLKAFQTSSKKKVVFLDYDGTLAASNTLPEFAKPSTSLLAALKRLSDQPNVYLYILSGRSREHMDLWFDDAGIGLCAEHGCFYRHPKKINSSLFDNLQSYNASPQSPQPSKVKPIPGSPTTLRASALSNLDNPNTVMPDLPRDSLSISLSSLAPLMEPFAPTSTPVTSEQSISIERLSLHQSPELSVQDTRDRARLAQTTTGSGDLVVFAPQQLWVPKRAGNGWLALVDAIDGSWRNTIRPLFEHYTERTPGSWIEEKEVNITWHYMNADPDFGSWQAAELQVNLERMLSHLAVSVRALVLIVQFMLLMFSFQIVLGDKTLELRPSSVDKVSAARSIMKDLGAVEKYECDFQLCIGDGKTDEPVFSFLNSLPNSESESFTVTVGKKQTEAKYYLETIRDVEGLITTLSK